MAQKIVPIYKWKRIWGDVGCSWFCGPTLVLGFSFLPLLLCNHNRESDIVVTGEGKFNANKKIVQQKGHAVKCPQWYLAIGLFCLATSQSH